MVSHIHSAREQKHEQVCLKQAIGCVAAVGGALAVMYGANRDVKKKEGNASLYRMLEKEKALKGH